LHHCKARRKDSENLFRRLLGEKSRDKKQELQKLLYRLIKYSRSAPCKFSWGTPAPEETLRNSWTHSIAQQGATKRQLCLRTLPIVGRHPWDQSLSFCLSPFRGGSTMRGQCAGTKESLGPRSKSTRKQIRSRATLTRDFISNTMEQTRGGED